MFSRQTSSGFTAGADLSGAAQSGLGVLSVLGVLRVCAPLLSCCPAESGLGLGAGSVQFCGAGGAGGALVH